MKKLFYSFACVAVIGSLIFVSCKKKKNEAITPTYKEEAGTASNPNPNNVTVTGTTNVTNPATQNSSFYVGGAGWSNPSCITTNSLYLKGINGETEVTLSFATPPPVGNSTYNIASTPGLNAVVLTVINAPNQPSGIMWYGRSGVVTVNSSTSAVSAVLTGTGVQCVQNSFNFPQVIVTGVLGCN